jgi:hypothetical protein
MNRPPVHIHLNQVCPSDRNTPRAHEALMRTTSNAARSSKIPTFRQVDQYLRRAHADRRAHQ